MFSSRLISSAVLIPLVIVFLVIGGWVYALAIGVVLSLGGLEYVAAMRKGGYQPYQGTLLITICMTVLAQAAGWLPRLLGPGLAGFLIIAMVAMLASYGRGDKIPVVNFGLTVAGALYIGWLGAHLVALRQLPDGEFWALIAVMATGGADMGAYVFGSVLGRHKMAPVVSPGKTWEGYFVGVITAIGMGILVAAFATTHTSHIRLLDGAAIGLVIGLISPAGDLGMSTIKRMVGIKNFSNILPGHGGMLDRLDSMLVGVTLSFYLITLALL
jgi:phosphatidate cytidylyltransferase